MKQRKAELVVNAEGRFFTKETPPVPPELTVEQKIRLVCDNLCDLLVYKNRKYGNAALQPINIFYKGGANEAIDVRLDDKISRIKNAPEKRKNDLVDVAGYLVLSLIENDWTSFVEYKD